jgi:transmembrane 9 superfamily protein 2/4
MIQPTNIPRATPLRPLRRHMVLITLAGLFPFAAISIEYYFILGSIWFHKIYYVFGFLLCIFLITTIVAAETSILCCYIMLCAEDYHWWWPSFLASGSAAFYIFLISGVFFATKIPVTGVVSALIYILWTLLACFLLFLALGAIGFLASFFFVCFIYNRLSVV